MAGKGTGLHGGRNRRGRRDKKFNRQNPSVRRHGPKGKRIVFREAIAWALTEHYSIGEWLTSSQIAEAANKQVPKMWTQLNGYSVGAVMRTYIRHRCAETRMKNNIKYWKLIKPLPENL